MDIITERLKLKDVFPDKAKNLITNYKLGADPDYIRKGLVAEKKGDCSSRRGNVRRISKTSYCHMGT